MEGRHDSPRVFVGFALVVVFYPERLFDLVDFADDVGLCPRSLLGRQVGGVAGQVLHSNNVNSFGLGWTETQQAGPCDTLIALMKFQ